jgi:DUF4097 and DUF4098 domain-containing protein YvlB
MNRIEKGALGALVLTSLLLGAAPLQAQERIDERVRAAATGRVEVVNTAGSVSVTAWDRNEVHVTGTLGRGAERLELSSEGDAVIIRVVLPRNARNIEGTDLQVRVPARRDVLVRTVSAEIAMAGVTGVVELQSVSGDVRVSGNPAEVTARSTSGGLEIGVGRTRRVVAASVSGDIRVRGEVQQNVEAEAVSGDVTVQARTPQVRAKAVSGTVEVRSPAERVVASSVSGQVRVFGDAMRSAEVETVSGSVLLEGAPARGANVNINSHSGQVDLRLPRNVAAEFEVRSFSGNIRNGFGPDAERTSRYAPGRELRFTAGQGGARIVVRTFSGSVNLTPR